MRGVLLLLAVLSVAGCGYNRGDRAVSGGLLGAGGGAVAGALVGGSPLAGAAIGGLGGAALGGLTSPNTVNLGRPAWQ